MALQSNYQTRHGLALEAAYIRVTYYHGDKENIAIEYAVYPSKALRDLNKEAIEVRNLTVPFDLEFNGNPIKFAYLVLKNKPELQEATDV